MLAFQSQGCKWFQDQILKCKRKKNLLKNKTKLWFLCSCLLPSLIPPPSRQKAACLLVVSTITTLMRYYVTGEGRGRVQKVLDAVRKFKVIWMVVINFVHYEILASLPWRRVCTPNRQCLRMRKYLWGMWRQRKLCSVHGNACLLSWVHNMIEQFTNIISISYCSDSFSFNKDL